MKTDAEQLISIYTKTREIFIKQIFELEDQITKTKELNDFCKGLSIATKKHLSNLEKELNDKRRIFRLYDHESSKLIMAKLHNIPDFEDMDSTGF